MKKLAMKIAVIALIANSAMAQKARVEGKDAAGKEVHSATVTGAGHVNAAKGRNNVLLAEARSFTQAADAGKLNDAVDTATPTVISYTYKEGGKERTEQVSVVDFLKNAVNLEKAGRLKTNQVELANQVVAAMVQPRAEKMNLRTTKLIAEAKALVESGTASEAEIASYTAKLTEANRLMIDDAGKTRNFDMAVEKALTEEQKKKLDECSRG